MFRKATALLLAVTLVATCVPAAVAIKPASTTTLTRDDMGIVDEAEAGITYEATHVIIDFASGTTFDAAKAALDALNLSASDDSITRAIEKGYICLAYITDGSSLASVLTTIKYSTDPVLAPIVYAQANFIYGLDDEVDGDTVDSGTCGESLVWQLTGTEEAGYTLTISGEGEMDSCNDPDVSYPCVEQDDGRTPYVSGLSPWYAYRASITTVVIEEGVTSIGVCAFESYKALSSVQLPSTLVHIDESAFENCTSLVSIDLPEDLDAIDDAVFRRCSALESITLPDSLTKLGHYQFSWCTSLTTINIGASLSDLSLASFAYSCTSLVAVNVSSANTTYYSVDGVLYSAADNSLLYYPEAKPVAEEAAEEGANEAEEAIEEDDDAADLNEQVLTAKSVKVKRGKSARLAVEGAQGKLVVKKASKKLKVKINKRGKLVIKATKKAKVGKTYKVKVYAKATSAYAQSNTITIKVKIKG